MASRDFKDVQALEREVKIIAGRVSTDGTSQNTKINGAGYSVGNWSGGVAIVTLEDKYSDLLFASAQLGPETTTGEDNLILGVEAHDVNGAKTVSFNCQNLSGADAAPVNSAWTFMLVLKNSSVT